MRTARRSVPTFLFELLLNIYLISNTKIGKSAASVDRSEIGPYIAILVRFALVGNVISSLIDPSQWL